MNLISAIMVCLGPVTLGPTEQSLSGAPPTSQIKARQNDGLCDTCWLGSAREADGFAGRKVFFGLASVAADKDDSTNEMSGLRLDVKSASLEGDRLTLVVVFTWTSKYHPWKLGGKFERLDVVCWDNDGEPIEPAVFSRFSFPEKFLTSEVKQAEVLFWIRPHEGTEAISVAFGSSGLTTTKTKIGGHR
jgi:hypothetical protein